MDRLENFVRQLQQIDISYTDPQTEWLNTVSGRLFVRLIPISEQLGKPLTIENQGGLFEEFRMGDETAHLAKRMADSTVGEDGGTIQTYAESWEYKRLPWWKEALDLEYLPVIFLDTPLSNLGDDALIADAESYFDPAMVVKKYHLNPKANIEREMIMRHWVKEQIIQLLNPLLDPHYEVRDYEQQLRLYPKSDEGIASRVIDNEAYSFALQQIKQIAAPLAQVYQAKESNMKNR